jgi:hypothetical protein
VTCSFCREGNAVIIREKGFQSTELPTITLAEPSSAETLGFGLMWITPEGEIQGKNP